jgi:hypothetical protein
VLPHLDMLMMSVACPARPCVEMILIKLDKAALSIVY